MDPSANSLQEVLGAIRDQGPILAVSGGGLSAADEQAVAALNGGSMDRAPERTACNPGHPSGERSQ